MTTLESRIEKLCRGFDGWEIDGMLVSQPANRRYLSGFDGSAGYLLLTPHDRILATDFRYLEQARLQAPGYQVVKISGGVEDWLPGLVAGLNLRQLGFEAAHVTFALYRRLAGGLGKAELPLKLVPLEGAVETLRSIKEPEEIEFIAKAALISDAAMEHAESIVGTGVTELELAWEIERFMRERGSETVPFEVIVASGPASARPHARPSSRRIVAGEPVLVDIGARVSGYASDLTRTLCFGAADETFAKVYDAVLGAQLAAIAVTCEGMTGEEADKIARIVIEEAGYGEAFGHSLGHGVGLAAHELPRLGPGSAEKLADGMVFTVEPGIYLAGWGGVRIEDTVVMVDGKIRVISKARKVKT